VMDSGTAISAADLNHPPYRVAEAPLGRETGRNSTLALTPLRENGGRCIGPAHGPYWPMPQPARRTPRPGRDVADHGGGSAGARRSQPGLGAVHARRAIDLPPRFWTIDYVRGGSRFGGSNAQSTFHGRADGRDHPRGRSRSGFAGGHGLSVGTGTTTAARRMVVASLREKSCHQSRSPHDDAAAASFDSEISRPRGQADNRHQYSVGRHRP
jgi:hypothetical protein